MPIPLVFIYYSGVIVKGNRAGEVKTRLAEIKVVVCALMCIIQFVKFGLTHAFMLARKSAMAGT